MRYIRRNAHDRREPTCPECARNWRRSLRESGRAKDGKVYYDPCPLHAPTERRGPSDSERARAAEEHWKRVDREARPGTPADELPPLDENPRKKPPQRDWRRDFARVVVASYDYRRDLYIDWARAKQLYEDGKITMSTLGYMLPRCRDCLLERRCEGGGMCVCGCHNYNLVSRGALREPDLRNNPITYREALEAGLRARHELISASQAKQPFRAWLAGKAYGRASAVADLVPGGLHPVIGPIQREATEIMGRSQRRPTDEAEIREFEQKMRRSQPRGERRS